MTEFDFDELDRSIANAMAQNKRAEEPAQTAQTVESNIEAPKISNDRASSALEATGSEPPQTDVAAGANVESAQIIAKRRGQFMDVVHPSSDMTKPAEKVKRTTVTLKPIAAAPVVDAVVSSSNLVSENVTPPTPKANAQNETETTASTLPEALAIGTEVNPEEAPATDTIGATTEVQSPEIDPLDLINTDELSETPTSPFVAGATLDKRPLGVRQSGTTNTSVETSKDSDQAEQSTSVDSVDASKEDTRLYGGTHGIDITPSADLEALLLEETAATSDMVGLSEAESRAKDIQSIEEAATRSEMGMSTEDASALASRLELESELSADSIKQDQDTPRLVETIAPASESEPLVEHPADMSIETVESTVVESTPQASKVEASLDTTEPAGPVSIPQQYRESTIDEIESGAIYDTSEYHTEVKDSVSAKKSHTTLKWILIGLIMLALGAVAGAGYFVLTR